MAGSADTRPGKDQSYLLRQATVEQIEELAGITEGRLRQGGGGYFSNRTIRYAGIEYPMGALAFYSDSVIHPEPPSYVGLGGHTKVSIDDSAVIHSPQKGLVNIVAPVYEFNHHPAFIKEPHGVTLLRISPSEITVRFLRVHNGIDSLDVGLTTKRALVIAHQRVNEVYGWRS